MNTINCLCHLKNIDTFAASTDKPTRENSCTFKFLVIKVFAYQIQGTLFFRVVDITTIIIQFSNFYFIRKCNS